jgi:hypothetical protein
LAGIARGRVLVRSHDETRDRALSVAEQAIDTTLPWCIECDIECFAVDEDACCSACGVDIWYDESGKIRRMNAALLALLDVRRILAALGKDESDD